MIISCSEIRSYGPSLVRFGIFMKIKKLCLIFLMFAASACMHPTRTVEKIEKNPLNANPSLIQNPYNVSYEHCLKMQGDKVEFCFQKPSKAEALYSACSSFQPGLCPNSMPANLLDCQLSEQQRVFLYGESGFLSSEAPRLCKDFGGVINH